MKCTGVMSAYNGTRKENKMSWKEDQKKQQGFERYLAWFLGFCMLFAVIFVLSHGGDDTQTCGQYNASDCR